MAYNKIDFINDLLSSKKLHLEDKTKILDLTKSELKNIEIGNEDIMNRIEKIEGLMKKGILNPIENDSKMPIQKENSKKHSPKTMVKFLYRFSIDEKFKWFTHSPDGLLMGFDYKIYIENAYNEFDKATGWNINNQTYYNIKNFIINTGESNKTSVYGKGKLKYSWRDYEKWCSENPNTHPYNSDLNDEKFKRYINQFKQIIEFRTDDADLVFNIRVRKLIRNLLGVDFNPVFSNSFNEIGQSVNIFCDINLLFNAIEQIIKWIVSNKAKSNEVEVDLVEKNEFFQLEIIHKNSFISSSSENEKLKGLSGDFDKVRKILFSVADWEILTTIKHNSLAQEIKIICLDSETELMNNVLNQNKIEKMKNVSNNVKHIIKLYKTQNL